jgi:hypothetical protein
MVLCGAEVSIKHVVVNFSYQMHGIKNRILVASAALLLVGCVSESHLDYDPTKKPSLKGMKKRISERIYRDHGIRYDPDQYSIEELHRIETARGIEKLYKPLSSSLSYANPVGFSGANKQNFPSGKKRGPPTVHVEPPIKKSLPTLLEE